MTIRAVIFDIGGVLEATPSTGWEERWAAKLGLSGAEFEERLAVIWKSGATGTATLREIEQRIGESLGLDQTQLRAFMDDVWTEYLGTLDVELAAYFTGLRPQYRTGILSNSFVGAREREQSAYGLEDMCDVIVYSHEEGLMKPDPRFYQIVCDRLEVAPDEAVFLDDVAACVQGALTLGMKAVRFLDTRQAIADVQRLLAA
ncbi:MAG: HAD family phosphatase [Solirubrobacteraceae bacterium]